MMNAKPRLSSLGRGLLLLSTFCVSGSVAAYGQANQPLFIPGEVVLFCQAGTPNQDVQTLAASVKAEKVEALLMPDCYKITLPADKRTNADTQDAVTLLKPKAGVRWVGVNRKYKLLQTGAPKKVEPNDTRYVTGEMWGLAMVRMPEAWAISKGGTLANACDIDSEFATTHEDLAGQFLPEKFNADDGSNNVDPLANDVIHGSHTSGTIIAKTNNGLGVAGICWENIKCLPIKSSLSFTSLLNAYAYVSNNRVKLKIAAVNMSYGAISSPNDPNDPEYVALNNLSNQGVLLVASAGNSAQDSTNHVPSGFAFVMSVSALGRTGNPAVYTNYGKVEIAAPGGDQSTANADGILSTVPTGYEFFQGTSMSAPHVTGIATFLMSHPGVTAARARTAIIATANRSKKGADPQNYYGAGLIDAYQALLRVSVRAAVLDPQGVDPTGATGNQEVTLPVQSFQPTLRFEIANVTCPNVTIKIDGETMTESFIRQNIESGDCDAPNSTYVVAFRRRFRNETPYQHTIQVTATNPDTGISATDTRQFTINPQVLSSGLSMISVPILEAPADSPTGEFRNVVDLLGADVIFYRWVPKSGAEKFREYAKIGGGYTDGRAGLRPTNITSSTPVSTAFSDGDARPLGIGYFANSPTARQIVTYGQGVVNQQVKVSLNEGWNMIGNPYLFAVPFITLQVELPGGARMPISEAAEKGLMQPYFYRYLDGEYTFDKLPNGTLRPWQGAWVYISPKDSNNPNPNEVLKLVFSPNVVALGGGSRAAGTNLANDPLNGQGGWSVRLIAKAGNLTDSNNFIGVSARSLGRSALAPKPPMPTNFVSLGIVRDDSMGLYAQDIQQAGGAKSWDLVVNTDQANMDVTLSWPDVRKLPRNYRLVLTDKVTGQSVDLRHQSSYRYNAGRSAEPRRFTLTARPTALGGRALLTSIFVNPSRNDGRSVPSYEIGYSVTQDVRVEATILGLNGKTLARVSPTRAASIGENRLTWNGRDSNGQPLAAGTYVLQLRAITTDNEVTREVRPFLITGR